MWFQQEEEGCSLVASHDWCVEIQCATRGKSGLAVIGGVLRNDKGVVLCMFSKGLGIRDSNDADVFAILEAWQFLQMLP